jgi:glycosyltransferase involved in cell wall biosynthesis
MKPNIVPNKKLSIITINLNNKPGLEKTFESIFAQTRKNFELIVVDGGSTDGSRAVIRKYTHRITKWVSEKDSGIYNAMNKGIAMASGQYCLFLNSGDLLYDLKSLDRILANNPESDIFYGDVIVETPGITSYKKKNQHNPTSFFLFSDMICHQVMFIKKSLFENYGFYDETFKIAADYEFLLRAVLKHQSSICYYPVTIARFSSDGISNGIISGKILKNERRTAQKIYFSRFRYAIYLFLNFIKKSANKLFKCIEIYYKMKKKNLFTHSQ